MGRKKIEIKLIKNQRIRNITYNKRKRGLLKKIVEITKFCGIQAKLQLLDIFGNLITLNAGQKEIEILKNEIPSEKQFMFNSQDYPYFKGFQKIRNRRQGMPNIETEQYSVDSEKSDKMIKLEQIQQYKIIVKQQQLKVQIVIKQKAIIQNQIKNSSFNPCEFNNNLKYLNVLNIQNQMQRYIQIVHLIPQN